MKKCVVFLLLFVLFFNNIASVFAASSPFSQSDWTGGVGTSTTNQYSASSNIAINITNQLTLNKQEKLTNTGFETNLTGWTANTTGFGDSSFAGTSGAVAAWPLDDTVSTQSYSRVINPAVATGRNMVLNGTFDTDTIWTKGTGWTIAGGVAHSDGTGLSASIFQTLPTTTGKAYSITFTLSNFVSGTVRPQIGSGAGTARSANGTYTETVIAGSTAQIAFATNGVSSFIGDIDNVTVTQVNIPAYNATSPTQLLADGDMETAGTAAWTAANSAVLTKQTTSPHGGTQLLRVAYNGTANADARQSILTIGQTYRITGYMRSDGTATPSVINSATLATGTTSTSWQPFDVVVVAVTTNVILRNTTSSGYVEFDDVIVSPDTYIRPGEIIQDGNMETSGTGVWVVANAATITKDTTSPHGGTQNLRVARSTVNNPFTSQGILTAGKTYRVTGYVKSDGSAIPTVTFQTLGAVFTGTTSTSWQPFDVTRVAVVTGNINLQPTTSTGTQYAEYDDISVTEIDPLSGIPTNGVTLGASSGTGGHLTTAYSFDGVNDFVNIYSSDLNSAINPSEGTAVLWAKVSSAGVWTDGTSRYFMQMGDGGNNRVTIQRTAGTNQVQIRYISGGTTQTVSDTSLSGSTNWFQIGVSWSKSSDQVKMYINGAQVGATQTGLGTWSANLGASTTVIGASATSGADRWSGLINDVRLYNTPLSAAQIAALYAGVTAVRDTSVDLTGVASAKVVSPEGTGTFVQSVNVGDTNQYNLVANAYTNGSAVTSADAQLWYNGLVVPTTYTSVGAGWYKLTGTITGVASSIEAGVQIQAGKTVYLDDLSLNNYPNTPGTLTSSIFDSGQASTWGTLTYGVSVPANTTLTVKVRTGNQSDLSDASAFAACPVIPNNTTVGGTSCANPGTRYAQYLLTFTTSDLLNTPTFTSFSLPFNQTFVVVLDSPANNSYTNNQRPTFQWEKSNASSGIGKYIIQIDNPAGNGFPANSIIVDNIPANRTTDLETSKYLIHYDTTSISFYTKSSSDWGPNENDGKLREGTVNWKVTAVDNAGNTTSASRTLFVDLTSPVLSDVTISGSTISGKLSDTASGPDSVDIKIEKKNFFGSYDLFLNATVKVTNNQFTFTPDGGLSDGTYTVTVIGKDNAGNQSSSIILNFSVPGSTITLAPSTTAVPVQNQPVGSPRPTATLAPIKSGPTSYINFNIGNFLASIWNTYVNFVISIQNTTNNALASIFNTTINAINSGLAFIFNTAGQGLAFVFNSAGDAISFVGSNISIAFNNTIHSINTSLAFWGSGYTSLANSAPNAIRSILLALGNVFNAIGNTTYNIAFNIWQGVGITGNEVVRSCRNINLAFVNGYTSVASNIQSIRNQTGSALANAFMNIRMTFESGIRNTGLAVVNGFNNIFNTTKNSISELVFNVGQSTKGISSSLGQSIIAFGYLLDSEPTVIQDVKVTVISSTSVKISWVTNQPTTGKVNYGLDETYPLETQSTKLVKNHEFVLTGLTPNTQYSFEVMSHGKNYVYDANRKFKTPIK